MSCSTGFEISNAEAPERIPTLSDQRDAFFDVQRDSLRKKTVRGTAVTLTSQSIKFSLRLLTTSVLARLLAPSDFGLVTMVVAVTGLVELFKDAGLSMATVQRAKITHREVSSLFWVNIGIGIVLAACVALIAPFIAWAYGEPRLRDITLAWAIVPIFGGIAAQPQAILQRKMQFQRLAGVEITSMLFSAVAAVAAARAGWGYWALVVMSISASAISMALCCLLSGWLPSPPRQFADVRQMLKFGGNLAGFNVVNYFSRNGDKLLIGWRWGTESLGLYSRAYNILTLPILEINTPIAAVIVPTLSRLHDSPDQYRKTYLSVVQNLAMVTMPLTAMLAVTSDWVIELILGPQWAGAAPIFSWMAIAGLIQPTANTVGWLFISQARTNELFRVGLIYSALCLAAFAVGLPFGAIGVAAAYALFDILIRTPLLFYCAGNSGPVQAGAILRSLIRPACMSGLVMLATSAMRLAMPGVQGLAGLMLASVVAAAVMLPFCIGIIARHRDQLAAVLGGVSNRKAQLEA